MKVAVFGLGYVGTVTAAGLASAGHDVVGVDVDTMKVDAINRGDSPVVEPGIGELLGDAVRAGHLRATCEAREAVAAADVSLICVGTPSGSHGETDLTYVSRALLDLRSAMAAVEPPAGGHHAVVVRSTVPPGTVTNVVAPVFTPDVVPQGWRVGAAMCPEFLREGCSVQDFFDPPFVVVGTGDDETAAAVRTLFGFLEAEVEHVAVETAEALKFACNAFHATKVSFANEMARVFRPYGVDSREVMEIFVRDTKLNIAPTYLRPAFAYGGSCLPKDLRSLQHLARSQDVDVPLLAGTALTNELVVRDIVERVIAIGDRRVCLLGLSFKSDTDDLRESPNVELAERLLGKGFDVRIYDPIINPERLVGANLRHVEAKLPHLNRLLARSPQEALDGVGVAIVTTADDEALAALAATPPPHVLDLHGRLGAGVEQLAGYQGAGW
ncbi:GDP-mannose 6-dehydrogenase [Mumia flava]|uniref:UDP-glucose 6-dehydrogenase n=1 Tax=Mumia flava TaxID=1348852 RepID=A0A2M9BG10_9ACTN|nr:nucleotide sugar dehydrogenase [Mumia flava]PJJ56871.1 GDP-mannose 6-dehydrogenase [Mumia flava]